MRSLYVKQTNDSPLIHFDKSKQIFKIEGNSFSDDPVPHYAPVLEWLDEYISIPNEYTEFEFKLNYVNTASSKQIANVLLKLKELERKQKQIKIMWYYKYDDEDIYDEGKSLAKMIQLPFEFIEYT